MNSTQNTGRSVNSEDSFPRQLLDQPLTLKEAVSLAQSLVRKGASPPSCSKDSVPNKNSSRPPRTVNWRNRSKRLVSKKEKLYKYLTWLKSNAPMQNYKCTKSVKKHLQEGSTRTESTTAQIVNLIEMALNPVIVLQLYLAIPRIPITYSSCWFHMQIEQNKYL